MQLFVIRHAIAEPRVADGDDAHRALTGPGERKLRQVVRGLRRLGLRFDSVLTSPWTRATQTSALLAPIARRAPIETPLLAQPPGAALLALIAQRSQRDETAAVVGHEPWLGELVGWLAFGSPRAGDGIAIKKAGVVWLDGTPVPGGMQLRAALPPKLLRAIG